MRELQLLLKDRRNCGGYLTLATAILLQAIEDFRHPTDTFLRSRRTNFSKKSRKKNKKDAKDFLFTDRLSKFLDYFSIQDQISEDVIRMKALG